MTATSGQGGQIGAQVPDEAVEAVAEAMFDACKWGLFAETAWDSLGTGWKVVWRDRARQVLEAAAPILVEAGRREVLDGAGCPPGSGLGRWVESNTHYDVEFFTADGETQIECFESSGSSRSSPYHAARTFAQRLHGEWVRSELRRSRADTYHADETVLERFGAWEPVDGGDS